MISPRRVQRFVPRPRCWLQEEILVSGSAVASYVSVATPGHAGSSGLRKACRSSDRIALPDAAALPVAMGFTFPAVADLWDRSRSRTFWRRRRHVQPAARSPARPAGEGLARARLPGAVSRTSWPRARGAFRTPVLALRRAGLSRSPARRSTSRRKSTSATSRPEHVPHQLPSSRSLKSHCYIRFVAPTKSPPSLV